MNSSLKTRAQGKPGNSGPAAFAFFCPGPQLGNFTKKISLASNTKPSARPAPTRWSGAEGSDGRFLRSQLRRIGPGRCPQARPCRQRSHPITITSAQLAKPELSTLHKIGTFYFALTVNTPTKISTYCFSWRRLFLIVIDPNIFQFANSDYPKLLNWWCFIR